MGWSIDWKVLVGNLLMLQDFTNGKLGVLFGTFEGDLPLWSLSYEWWFYLMFFPVYSFVAERAQLLVVTAIGVLAAVFYNIIHFSPLLFVAYFPIWWAGIEIGRAVAHQTQVPIVRIAAALGVLSMTFAFFVVLAVKRGQHLSLGIHPFLEFRHAGAALAFVISLVVYRRFIAPRLDRVILPFAMLAPISYGIYALHYPIVNNAAMLALPLAVRIPVVICVVLIVAWFAEMPYQKFVLQMRKSFMRALQTEPSIEG